MTTRGKVFILESPGPLDLLEERGERFSIEQVCKLFGHYSASFLIRDSEEFKQTLMYISSISQYSKAGKSPLFIHISLHGDGENICIGSDDVSWKDLAAIISKSYKSLDQYKGPIILIISACGGNEQKLTYSLSHRFKKGSLANPPEYIFVFSDFEVEWRDAVVTWTIFYRKVSEINFNPHKKKEAIKIKKLLDKLQKTNFGTLTYFRWTGKKYKSYASKSH